MDALGVSEQMEHRKGLVELGFGSVLHYYQGQGLAQGTNTGQPPDLQSPCKSLFKQGVQGTSSPEWGKQISIGASFEGNCRRHNPTIMPFTFQLHPQVTNNYQLPLILNGRERNTILSLLFTFHNITNNLSYWEGQRQEKH